MEKQRGRGSKQRAKRIATTKRQWASFTYLSAKKKEKTRTEPGGGRGKRSEIMRPAISTGESLLT